ncbi:uncharacterized protein RMCC_5041 [Mycolicibacterium canariasense]|uniref:Uncharacterized protein n=1 Tax=Mycolicibacterium canariasense TaxID=228230 RepID=A0A100WGY2_MYCCR|nr:hypothetical protein [Mycolicibacterium canariasense]MCV7212938.1 hypothetical protein [Mycolicibacterium canariasense]ORV10259.1 hypothetical protein AWB94_08065 [Mycolicibacterium canariasense]GAS98076.1 uncharacterized protein RMCC_5041 [Mycolicibacterium canariasense]
MRRALYAAVSTVVIAAAAWMWHNLPTPDDVYASFDVHAGMGERATGDAITAQVTGVRIGPRIHKKLNRPALVDALGTWVAIDGEAMTTRTDQVPTVDLLVGPNTYVPTNRLGFTALTGNLTPGIAVRSSWIFDVPPELVAPGAPTITLRVWVNDWRQDSRLVMAIPLDDPRVQRTDVIDFAPATQVGT